MVRRREFERTPGGADPEAMMLLNRDPNAPVTTAEDVARAVGGFPTPTTGSSEGSDTSSTPEVFRDPQTGKITAVLNNGKFLPFGDDTEARAYLERQSKIRATPTGAVEAEDAANQRALFAQNQLLSQQIGNINPQQAIQGVKEAPIDLSQALTAGTIGAVPSAIRSIGTGVIGGALLGGGAGAIGGPIGAGGGALIGAGVGLVASIAGGVSSNIKSQQAGEIGSATDVLTAAKTNMRQLAILAKQDPAHADKYVQQYNEQLVQVHRARQKIKLETQGNLNKFMEDGTDIISDFDLFLQPGGQADIYGQRLRIALIDPNSLELTSEDVADAGITA